MIIPKFPVPDNPKLLDAVIGGIQPQLLAKIPWLDYSFGKAQRIVKVVNGRRRFIPSVYQSKNEYFEVTPDQNIGNFCFWWVEDPQNFGPEVWPVRMEVNFSLIFWFNLAKVWRSKDNRDVETLKLQILQVLKAVQVKEGGLNITRVYEQAENVYRGFTLDEAENQFLIHPFAGLRFNGVLTVDSVC